MPTNQSTTLSAVPVAKRKQLAATLGLFAVLFVAVGAVAATGPETLVVRVFVVVALIVAVLLALMGWGVVHSIRDEHDIAADRDLDALIDEALAAAPRKFGSLCNCGHEHDPTELHVVDAEPVTSEACAHDGGGIACNHDCADCVLTSLRPSPSRTRSDRLSS